MEDEKKITSETGAAFDNGTTESAADVGTATQATYYYAAKKTEYKKPYFVLAWILPIAAFLFLEIFWKHDLGLGATLFVLAFAVISYFAAKKLGGRLDKPSLLLLGVIVALAPVFFVTENIFMRSMTIFFEIVMIRYWVLYTFRRCDEFLAESMPLDYVKSALIPYASFGNLFGAQGASIGKGKRGKSVLYFVIGCVIAILPVIVVVNLLRGGDMAFGNMIDEIESHFSNTVGEHIGVVILAIPVAMYFFGMFHANAEKKAENFISEGGKKRFFEKAGVAPAIAVCAVIVPLCVVYVMFFFSQLSYFTSAFANYLPEGFTYSQYAVNGFGELVAVSVINSVVLFFGRLFTKKTDGKSPLAVRVVTIVLSVFTLMLIAISMSKLVMYMRAYGLTQARLISSWFMIGLAFVFIGVIVKQFAPKFRFVRAACILFAVMFAILAYADVDRVVGETNVVLYKNGVIDQIDVYQFKHDLDDSSWTALEKLSKGDDPLMVREVSVIAEKKIKNQDHITDDTFLEKIFCRTIPEMRARAFYESLQ